MVTPNTRGLSSNRRSAPYSCLNRPVRPCNIHRRKWAAYIVATAYIATIGACNAYDQNLLNRYNDMRDSGGDRGVKDHDSGLYQRTDAVGLNTTTSDANTRDEEAINSGVDICGDGQVTGTELCDTGIMAGKPGACPIVCTSGNVCIDAHLTGSGCQTKCVHTYAECKNGDNCCPSSCNAANDSDCSATCGDGIVQAENGETCESAGAVADAGTLNTASICPTKCEDDGNACIKQVLSGSAANCNARCTKTEKTTFGNDDGCCPAGGNANLDNDCAPICGNGIKEPGEACDGSFDCNSQCKLQSTAAYERCTGELSGVDGECEKCLCTNCANEVERCFESGDSTRDTGCAKVVNCGLEKDCEGAVCYCGGITILGTCISPIATGVCKNEIESVAGTTDMIAIFTLQTNAETAIGRSTALTACHVSQCGGC
jgi:hypothetical protein